MKFVVHWLQSLSPTPDLWFPEDWTTGVRLPPPIYPLESPIADPGDGGQLGQTLRVTCRTEDSVGSVKTRQNVSSTSRRRGIGVPTGPVPRDDSASNGSSHREKWRQCPRFRPSTELRRKTFEETVERRVSEVYTRNITDRRPLLLRGRDHRVQGKTRCGKGEVESLHPTRDPSQW